MPPQRSGFYTTALCPSRPRQAAPPAGAVGAGLDCQSPPVLLVIKGGAYHKNRLAPVFATMGRRVRFPESPAVIAGGGGGRVRAPEPAKMRFTVRRIFYFTEKGGDQPH